jgi:hypothetical protein
VIGANDTWHFFRSHPDFELLARIPGDRIFAVQVDAAAVEVRGSFGKIRGTGSFRVTARST